MRQQYSTPCSALLNLFFGRRLQSGHLARCLIDCKAATEEIITAYMQAIRLNPRDIRAVDECSKYALSVCKARACNPVVLRQALELLLGLTANPAIFTELTTPRAS